MPRRIHKTERIIDHIGEPIEALRVARTGHQRIRTDEAPQLCVIPARVVETQPLAAGEVLLVVLARKALGGCVAKGAATLANDDAGGTKKPRRMGLSSGAV